jgi:hypothetical protein
VTIPQISLEALADIPVLPRGAHIALLQKCIVVLDNQGHESGAIFLVEMVDGSMAHAESNAIKEYIFQIRWRCPVDDVLRAAHQDLIESVEDSAKALGLLLIAKMTPYTAGRQSLRRTHVDYYLVDADAPLPFQAQTTALVECTGIINNVNEIDKRIKEKKNRLSSIRRYPVYIVCIEHSFPMAKIEKVPV